MATSTSAVWLAMVALLGSIGPSTAEYGGIKPNGLGYGRIVECAAVFEIYRVENTATEKADQVFDALLSAEYWAYEMTNDPDKSEGDIREAMLPHLDVNTKKRTREELIAGDARLQQVLSEVDGCLTDFGVAEGPNLDRLPRSLNYSQAIACA